MPRGTRKRWPIRAAGKMAAAMISEVKSSIQTCQVATTKATATRTPTTWKTSGHGSLFIRGGPRNGRLPEGSCVHGRPRGEAAIGAVAHPAARALGEVVIDARRPPGADQQRDRLARRHNAILVAADAGRPPPPQAHEPGGIGRVPIV